MSSPSTYDQLLEGFTRLLGASEERLICTGEDFATEDALEVQHQVSSRRDWQQEEADCYYSGED